MLRGKWKYVVIVMLSAITTVLFSSNFFKNGVRVEFDAQSELPVDYQMFYITDGEEFGEEKSIHVRGRGRFEREHIEMIIVSEDVSKIRLDFGTGLNHIIVKNFKINRESINLQKLFTTDTMHQIDDVVVNDGMVSLKTSTEDPLVIVPFRIKASLSR